MDAVEGKGYLKLLEQFSIWVLDAWVLDAATIPDLVTTTLPRPSQKVDPAATVRER